jgi:pimeloyl-ACP methyl ester carboxylesterase
MVIPECLQRITDAIKDDTHVILVGSSFGGFLAAATALHHTTVKQMILLNPAIIPPNTNLRRIQEMPPQLFLQMMHPELFEQKIPATISILRGTDDTVVPDTGVLAFAKAQEASVYFLHDDHAFSKNLSRLPAVISKILREGSY